MGAKLIFRDRIVYSEHEFAEIVIWQVPQPVPTSTHSFKYRLAYISGGRRVLGFDNERGKGDHRHDGRTESLDVFSGVDRLLNDFAEAIETWRAAHGKD